MIQVFVRKANQLLRDLSGSLRGHPTKPPSPQPVPATTRSYEPLRRLLLTDGVSRTLFEEYANHRKGSRGEEETGWVLLGLRDTDEAIALATLPAGTEREAGVAHVRFNSSAQAVGSRFVRQLDRRLSMLGVVHTHPGSLRHPSDGDFRGDSEWVGQLRGQQGIFGIGTADGHPNNHPVVARQPKPHAQCLGALCLSWYSLRPTDANYRPLPVELTLGPDLARPLHSIWPTLEANAERLDRLARQQNGVRFDVVAGQRGDALAISIPLAEPGDAIRVLLEGKEVTYVLARHGDLLVVDQHTAAIDQGVYLLLAELASQS